MYHISVQENNKSFSAFSINNPVTNANIWLIRNAIQIPVVGINMISSRFLPTPNPAIAVVPKELINEIMNAELSGGIIA